MDAKSAKTEITPPSSAVPFRELFLSEFRAEISDAAAGARRIKLSGRVPYQSQLDNFSKE
jgi:hypothetical protein